MIVQLTHYQSRSIMNRVPELHADAMREHRETYGRSSHLYDLPAIAWRQILDHLLATCFGPLGGKLDKMPQSVYSGVAAVSSQVMAIERHPALRKASIMGHTGAVVPVWDLRSIFEGAALGLDQVRVYPPDDPSIYRFVLLVPHHVTEQGHDMTRWFRVERRDQGIGLASWTFNEESHLMFTRRRADA